MKRTAKAALANRGAIADAIGPWLPPAGTVLELGSGTGEHVLLLAARFPHLAWQPSDPDPAARASIAAWSAEARRDNILPPLDLDLRVPTWRGRAAAAVLCVNVLHVAPPECGPALCAGAARVLPAGGPLLVYGPFTRRGAPLAGRLARLARDLATHGPALGVREIEPLVEAARAAGLALADDLVMPTEGDRLLVFVAGRLAPPPT